jgi:hypothetical protein
MRVFDVFKGEKAKELPVQRLPKNTVVPEEQDFEQDF